jgi:hypothetical protein
MVVQPLPIINIHDNNAFVENVCLSFRHDFGLLSEQDKQKIRFECMEWIRAINNNKNQLEKL